MGFNLKVNGQPVSQGTVTAWGKDFRTSKGFDPSRYFSGNFDPAVRNKFTGLGGMMRYMADLSKFGGMQQKQQQPTPQTPPTHQPPVPQQPQFGMAQGSAQGINTGKPQFGQAFPQQFPQQFQQSQFPMGQGATQGMGGQQFNMGGGQTDPYGYMPPQLGQLMKTLGLNNTGRFTGFPR